MGLFVLDFQEIDAPKRNLGGGKAANLAELTRIEGLQVPDGFCVTTEAFSRIISDARVNELLDRLSMLKVDDRQKIREWCSDIRSAIERTPIPEVIASEIIGYLARYGEQQAWAVRSSATTEDMPSASFAGLQDTYLNVIGMESVLRHVSKCWASLFTDRAVIYRIQNGFGQRLVSMAVVIQKMVFPQVAGILFTADPINGNRKVTSIDAGFGLGEAMVSGLVNADNYKVREGKIIDIRIAAGKLAVLALKDGGTELQEMEQGMQNMQALPDEQIAALERIGRKIEAHFGCPQDIEWCLADTFFIVQSRPITTLFPIPAANDADNHVYVSVGHQQMMTDAMRPLGLSLWQLIAFRPMYQAGGRLFVDVTRQLASTATREMLLTVMGEHDPLIQDALTTIVERGDIIQPTPNGPGLGAARSSKGKSFSEIEAQIENDPAIVSRLISRSQKALDELQHNIHGKSGVALFDTIRKDFGALKQQLSDPQGMSVIMAGIDATSWINAKMLGWLGEKNVADTLSQSAPNNVTSEMGLALLDVADAIRPYPEVIEFLKGVKGNDFLDGLVRLKCGREVHGAINAYLNKYGMRCTGEIDITQPRWSERPSILIPLILSNIKNFGPGAGKRKFEQGLMESLKKEQEISDRLRQLPDGEQKALDTKQMISRLRNFIGYREYPKYAIVKRLFMYKQALLKVAGELVQTNVIHDEEDIWYLTFEELRDVFRTHTVDDQAIANRKEAYQHYKKLSPPRVITSDGEIFSGRYRLMDLPQNAIAGLAVSTGITEGRARVILKMEDADLDDGDILVTTFTDPSWTPLFVSIKGLVTEVGGMMTHGAVIAREYGLPAVVGVERATQLIKDGQRIRVNGTEGWVEIL